MTVFQSTPDHPLFHDLTGAVFGQLTVLGFLGRPKPRAAFRWLCRCSCGVEKSVQGPALTTGATISCGCYHRRRRTDLPFAERNKQYQQTYRRKNTEVRKQKLRDWRSRCPERTYQYNREYAYRRKYGINLAEALALLESQGGKCAICQSDAVFGGTGGPVVDHDHATGRVRGVLCRACNVGIGCFRDNQAFLLAAIDYLDSSQTATPALANVTQPAAAEYPDIRPPFLAPGGAA